MTWLGVDGERKGDCDWMPDVIGEAPLRYGSCAIICLCVEMRLRCSGVRN